MKKDGFSQVVSWCRFEWSVHCKGGDASPASISVLVPLGYLKSPLPGHYPHPTASRDEIASFVEWICRSRKLVSIWFADNLLLIWFRGWREEGEESPVAAHIALPQGKRGCCIGCRKSWSKATEKLIKIYAKVAHLLAEKWENLAPVTKRQKNSSLKVAHWKLGEEEWFNKYVFYLRYIILQWDTFPFWQFFYDLWVPDSAIPAVCFRYSALRKPIISVFDPEIGIAKTDGHN